MTFRGLGMLRLDLDILQCNKIKHNLRIYTVRQRMLLESFIKVADAKKAHTGNVH